MKVLPIGRARWFETEWEQLWVEAEMLACDYNFLVGVDSVAEYFVMSGDAEEDSLLGRETEGLIGKLAAIFIDGAEGAYGWDLADVGFAMEDDFEDSLLGIAAGGRNDVVQVRGVGEAELPQIFGNVAAEHHGLGSCA